MSVIWNPSDKGTHINLSNGDLTATSGVYGTCESVRTTLSLSSGKWYWEIYVDKRYHDIYVGVGNSSADINSCMGKDANGWGYIGSNGNKITNDTQVAYGDAFNTGDVIGVALDLDNGKIWFAKNNVWQASGDPVAGTNEAYSGLSGSLFPMGSCITNENSNSYDSQTIRPGEGEQSYAAPSGFTPIGVTLVTNFFDGKVSISPSTKPFDGKVCINTPTDFLDGKVDVKGTTTNSFNGKAIIRDTTTHFFNGKVVIKDTATNILDGKVRPNISTLNILDGKIILYPIITGALPFPLFDIEAVIGTNAYLDEFFPFFNVEAFTGGVANLTFPFFNVGIIAKSGEVLSANLILPSLTLKTLTGINGLATFPFLECNGDALVGSLIKGNIELPLVKLNTEALVNIISRVEASFPGLRIDAKGLGGILVTGNTNLYPLHLVAKGQVGPLANTIISLPCLIVEGESVHQITGIVNITFPMISLFDKASTLTKGCEILYYKRRR